MHEPEWLTIARELQAIAQTGLTYTQGPYDRARYERLRELASKLMARAADTEIEKVVELFRGEYGYATPKVDVRGAAFDDGRILLVREAADGMWTLPGGWADVNQTAAECAVREVREESGFEVRAVKLAAVHDYARNNYPQRALHSVYKLFFLCEITGGAARPSEETSEVAFFSPSEIPVLSTGRTTAAQIELMFAHRAEPARSTDFD
jgi:ADP-ribose pyrophosphatase YjhB (NUDIX family)